jgi:undecaprenyl-phosphate 4-deoxy-4-formamido-L-arabinose transferase
MDGKPELSIVVTVLNEERTVDELYERTVAAVNGRPFELLFVDDGSTDHTFEALRRLHERDARVHAVRFTRNFGQHPAMHAGFTRARGDILVTMDGDLQNQPEDIPKLVAAVEAGADVASGRRNARRDSWGRTLPSRMINGMLRRFTGWQSAISAAPSTPTAAARVEPMLGSIGRQKFTKALVLSGGASVVEVDVAHARGRGLRATPAAPHPPRAPRPRRILAAADPVDRSPDGRRLRARCNRTRHLRRDFLDHRVELPGPLFGGMLIVFVLGIQGFILALVGEYLGRIQRQVEGSPLYTISEEL